MNIFLIGYRCTGKTGVGKRVAGLLKRPFVDTDARVVSRSRQNIDRIVHEAGWPAFRRLEREALREIAAVTGQVVATGGGIVLDTDNVALMKQTGRVILLTADISTILRRMRNDTRSAGMRPALTAEKDLESEIRRTLTRRRPLYEAAMDVRVATDSRSVGAIARDIVSRFASGTA